ncbi:DUF418 domain-containing protein [Thalassotalea castellviae]|uniref:DUF418 domain-containing protein n=1 Tax=Thalassotalea castellviae TaxID=3075612 RepID=A0ABU3A2L9_9GAMM|nr:DUF418 domain-containing protein [Thalassotalea sp. W431]MDT0604414.1 DUF418 domain-containing protein [Thalassotalea sp. W431]
MESTTNTGYETPTHLSPVEHINRIQVMDLLRGFAIIGILFMNIEWFNRPINDLLSFDLKLTGLDWAASWLVKVFIEGKFYRIFSLLFGMGFAVMLLKAQAANKPFGAWFSRRMLVLFILGICHLIFLWNGDILHDYAVGGMLLLGVVFLLRTKRFAKRNHPNTYLKIALWIMALPLFIAIAVSLFFGITRTHQIMTQDWREQTTVIEQSEVQLNSIKEQAKRHALSAPELDTSTPIEENSKTEQQEPNYEDLTPEEKIAHQIESRVDHKLEMEQKHNAETEAFTQSKYAVATQFRIKQAMFSLKITPVMAIFICLPLFLIGYWLVASERITKPESHQNFFNILCWGGLIIGVIVNISGTYIVLHPATQGAIELEVIGEILQYYGQLILSLGYLALMVKLSQKRQFLKYFSWLSPLGKMALTNYITHSIILTSIFYGYAGGMFGQIARAEQMLIVVAIIFGQVLFSKLWLNYFKFGPLEWIWRSLTYLTWQPLRRSKV